MQDGLPILHREAVDPDSPPEDARQGGGPVAPGVRQLRREAVQEKYQDNCGQIFWIGYNIAKTREGS